MANSSLLEHDVLSQENGISYDSPPEQSCHEQTQRTEDGVSFAHQTSSFSSSIDLDNSREKLQSVVFLEDAVQYRSIHHKATYRCLGLYRWYHSSLVQSCVKVTIFLILMLAFFEDPSSLSWSSDPRRNTTNTRISMPPGFTEGIEVVCLAILSASNIIQCFLTTSPRTPKLFIKENRWLSVGFIVLVVSYVDVAVSLFLGNTTYRIRLRRLLRPYFLAQHTTMLKKTVKAMWNTMPEIVSVLTLLSLHLYFFTMLGMLLFPQTESVVNGTRVHGGELNSSESQEYFKTVGDAAMSLVVLLTTANNPDIMMPAYSENRLFAIYFILFSLIGTFLIFNLLTAIIYNQFRGYFKNSMQSSHFRRCVALSAAFHSLVCGHNHIDTTTDGSQRVRISEVEEMVAAASMTFDQRRWIVTILRDERAIAGDDVGLTHDQFCDVFLNIDSVLVQSWTADVTAPQWSSRHLQAVVRAVETRWFVLIGNLVVLLNAVLMTIEIAIHYEADFHGTFSRLNIMNYVFVVYYCVEQALKLVAKGKQFFVDPYCLYDGVISLALLSVELAQLSMYHTAYPKSEGSLSLWDCARIVNILVLLRLLRIIPNIRPMRLVTAVLIDIIQSLRSFAGIIVIIYYVFAVLGMQLFERAIPPPPGLPPSLAAPPGATTPSSAPLTPVFECGTYKQLNYWANNFDDFAASLVILWDVMVVNNWGVFLSAYGAEVGPAAQLFFVAWWLISAVVVVNLFIALILDHFIAKWDDSQTEAVQRRRGTVQSLFRDQLRKPSQVRVREELRKHPNLRNLLGPGSSVC